MSTSNTVTITIAKQKLDVEAEYRTIITGMNTVYANVDPYRLNGQDMSKAALLAKFQSRVDAAEATKSARAALRARVAEEKALDKEVKPLRAGLKSFIQSREGKASPVLQTFGFPEPRTPKTTPAVKAEAAVKAKATRTARGTKGRKQKAPIHGTPAAQASTGAPQGAATAAPPVGASGNAGSAAAKS